MEQILINLIKLCTTPTGQIVFSIIVLIVLLSFKVVPILYKDFKDLVFKKIDDIQADISDIKSDISRLEEQNQHFASIFQALLNFLSDKKGKK